MRSTRYGLLLILITLAAIVPAAAQTDPPTQAPPPPTETPPPAPAAAATPAAQAGPSRLDYGVRFGPSFTTLTGVETFDVTAAAAAFEPTLNFGGFLTYALRGSLAFQPEVIFAAKGHRVRDKDAEPITTPTGEKKLPAADRVILVRYLEIPLLLRLSRRTNENTSLYVVAGPALALRRGGAVIRQVSDPGIREDIADLVSGSDFSYIAGAGFQHKRWLVDARITRGTRNIASGRQRPEPPPSPDEPVDAEPVDPEPVDTVRPQGTSVKTGAFSVLMGVRF